MKLTLLFLNAAIFIYMVKRSFYVTGIELLVCYLVGTMNLFATIAIYMSIFGNPQ